jgi:hypothetical protein
MIITVTRIVIIGDKRIEKTATAQIESKWNWRRAGRNRAAPDSRAWSYLRNLYAIPDPITEAALSLFASLGPES